MKHPPANSSSLPGCELGGPEQRDFDLVIANALSMGWLSADQTMRAVRRGTTVIVSAMQAGSTQERIYEDGQRWLYQLLHDLAQGKWKQTLRAEHPSVGRLALC